MNILEKYKNKKLILGLVAGVILLQTFIILKLYIDKDDKTYAVNLVKVQTQKDSIDMIKLKSDLTKVDQTVRSINQFLKAKKTPSITLEFLSKDSISNAVYLSKQTARYSEYLANLEKKLQEIPLGIPVEGYISSQFGKRKNPIPTPRILTASIRPIGFGKKTEKDSLNKSGIKVAENLPPAEADQMQFHKGIDIAASFGSDVFCAAKGKVIFAGSKGGYGNCVIVSHGNGLATLYGHLSEILVKANQEVKVGEIIAKSGNSGRSTGPHLHYEVHKNNTPVNPKLFLNL